MYQKLNRAINFERMRTWFQVPRDVLPRADTSNESHRRQAIGGRITGLAWLVFLGSPLAELFRGHHSDTYVVLGLLGLASFIAIYVYGFFRTFFKTSETWRAWGVVLSLAALASSMSILLGSTRLITMVFVVTAACLSLPEAIAASSIAGIAALTAAVAAVTGVGLADIASLLFQLVLIGIALIFLRRLIRINAELRLAREENARLAVAEERLRFARDLHDLLGHSLSLIALKGELAGRLIEVDPARATAEVNDIEQVTRDALREVRDAVSGYRQPALDTELSAARAALDAAGIECNIVRRVGQLPPSVDAALGWAVREGVTNVIRHSAAQHCDIHVAQQEGNVALSIANDGHRESKAERGRSNHPGYGLAGLRERLAELDARLNAGPEMEQGFRLLVTIPVAQLSEKIADAVTPYAASPRLVVEQPQ